MTDRPRVELIAEVANSHGGDLELAKAFIWEFATAGATWIKFQSYQVQHLRPGDAQTDWLTKAELSDNAHYILMDECAKAKVGFLTTVFTADRIPFLTGLGLAAIKIGSGESSFLPRQCVGKFPRVIASAISPHSSPDGIEWLRCVPRYPAPWGLASVIASQSYYGNIVGYSDHAVGGDCCASALVAGARIVEKHVWLHACVRPQRPFEAIVDEFRILREWADYNPRFESRWQSNLRTETQSATDLTIRS